MPKVIVVQPTVPKYRESFFNRLASRLGDRFCVYSSELDVGVLTQSDAAPRWRRALGRIRSFPGGLFWQSRVLNIPIERHDILVISGAPRFISNIFLLIKCKLKGAQAIWWGHYWSSSSRTVTAQMRFQVMKLSDALLFYTDQEVAEYSTHSFNRSAMPVFALNNGIETVEIAALRRPYVCAERAKRILFIGRITPKAELGVLLRALAEPECQHVLLDIIGGGEAKAKLLQLARDLGIQSRVTWHGGVSEEAKIATIANDCRLFVYPGSVGLSLIHALAYGLPAVLHDDRWAHMPEIAAFKRGENGQVFAKGDFADLAHVIATLVAEPRKLEGMSQAAVATTAHSYNADDMASRFCAAISRIDNSMDEYNAPTSVRGG